MFHAVLPHVEISVISSGIVDGVYEPLMFVAGVVRYEVQDDFDIQVVRLVYQLAKILDGAIVRIYAVVVADVVALVDLWRFEDGR